MSMLARRLTTLRPAMTLAEAIETTRIHSVAPNGAVWSPICHLPRLVAGLGAIQFEKS
jgi:predicted ATPase with chaperone activity